MTMPMTDAAFALTEKEKEALRLMVRGHDAKSIARSLGLSVYTINDRLRDARRKMAVSSSREAARLLLTAEGGDVIFPTPEFIGDREIGEDGAASAVDERGAPVSGAGRISRRSRTIIGVLAMTLILGLLALAAQPDATPVPSSTPVAAQEAGHGEINVVVVEKARSWLALLDEGRWDDSYQATGSSFRKLNSLAVWTQTSEKVRVPLGAMQSRTLIRQENLPAPPYGYEVVKFRTRFANKADAVETVTLDHEDGQWRVVGVTVG
jgi:DNA-binding CsgD family transcriptional regulator